MYRQEVSARFRTEAEDVELLPIGYALAFRPGPFIEAVSESSLDGRLARGDTSNPCRQYRIDAQKAEAARKAASYQVLIGGKLNVS